MMSLKKQVFCCDHAGERQKLVFYQFSHFIFFIIPQNGIILPRNLHAMKIIYNFFNLQASV